MTSALRELAWRHEIDAATARSALERLLAGPVEAVAHPELQRTATAVAARLGWAKTYDAEYVALAQLLDIRLVTLDAGLARGAGKEARVVGPMDPASMTTSAEERSKVTEGCASGPLTSVTGSGDAGDAGETRVTPAQPVHPYVHVVVIAVIGAVSVLVWLTFYETVNRWIWGNSYVVANPWLFPVICLPFSLLVGLLVKYRNAPTNLGESMLDSLGGDVSRIDWRSLPVTVVMALVSLFSGAVIGPEGGIGGIASKIAALYNDKVAIPTEHRAQLVFSTLAAAYNGLIANPLFTGVLGSELVKDPVARTRTLPANLIGGAIGYLIFFAAGSSGLENYLHIPPPTSYQPIDVVLVVLFGLLGLVLALLAGVLFRIATAFFGRFKGREVDARSPGTTSAEGGIRPSCCSPASHGSRPSWPISPSTVRVGCWRWPSSSWRCWR